jgi:hypothetical protein
MLFQLDSRLRYEQLRQSIEQTYDQGYINKKERTLLLNRLSANSITQILIRRKLNNMVKRSEKHESSDKNNQRYLMSKEGHINEISKGESEHVEFKESFFFDVNRASKDIDYQKNPTPNDKMFDSSIGKNIAAFLNTRDGRIYVGVSDDGKIVGLEKDFQLMQKIKTKNVPVDSLKLRFSERMKKIIPEWGAVHNLVELRFIEGFKSSKDIVVIFVQKSEDTPVEIIIEGKRIFATRTTSGVFTDYSLDTQRKYITANFKI